MAKRISISISDDMHTQLQKLKEDMTGSSGKRKISAICQNALKDALTEAEASRAYRFAGVKDSQQVALILSGEDKQLIAKFLSKTGPYKFWSKQKKIEELKTHFEAKKQIDIKQLYPKFIDIMESRYLLHPWIKHKDELIAEDRRSEMAWSYVQGCFEGVYELYMNKEGK